MASATWGPNRGLRTARGLARLVEQRRLVVAWTTVGTLEKDRCLGVKDLNNQWLYEHDVVTSKEHDGAWLVVHFANQWALVQQNNMISAPTSDRQLKRIGFKFPED